MKCPNDGAELIPETRRRKGRKVVDHLCRKCGFTAPKNDLKIERIYAYVSADEDGNEGIICMSGPDGPLPLVGADTERMKQLEPIVQNLTKEHNYKVNLLLFEKRRLLKSYG